MGTTTGGLSYPEDTDQILAGAQAIKGLAQSVDARPRLRARKAGSYNLAGTNADIEQGSGGAAWDVFEVNFNNATDTVGMVAPLAGFYFASCSIALLVPASTSNLVWGCKILNNTQSTVEGLGDQKLVSTGAGSSRIHCRCAGLIKAAAGDIIRMSAHTNISGTQSAGGPTPDFYTRLGITYLGP